MEGKEPRPAHLCEPKRAAYPVGEAAGAAASQKDKVKEEELIVALEKEGERRFREFLAENCLESAPASEWQSIQLATSEEESAFSTDKEPEAPPLQPAASNADAGTAGGPGRGARPPR